MSLLFGIATPLEPAGSSSLFVNEADVATLGLKGKALKLEHQRARYGEVLDAWADTCPTKKCRNLYILAKTDDSFAGRRCDELLKKGELRELSLGHCAEFDKTTWKAGAKRAFEVSIVHKGARDGCRIVHVSHPRGSVDTLDNISSSALHKCDGRSTVELLASATMATPAATDAAPSSVAKQPELATNNANAHAGDEMDVLTKRLAEAEEEKRIVAEKQRQLEDELKNTANALKRYRDEESERMTAQKNDWIKSLMEMFKKNGEQAPEHFENSVHSLSETEHTPFVRIMASVSTFQKSAAKEIEDLQVQLKQERDAKKQMTTQNAQKDGTIKALRGVQAEHRDALTAPPVPNTGTFAAHGDRFQPTPTTQFSSLPTMGANGEYGRVVAQRTGFGMQQLDPVGYAKLVKESEGRQGMDVVMPPRRTVA